MKNKGSTNALFCLIFFFYLDLSYPYRFEFLFSYYPHPLLFLPTIQSHKSKPSTSHLLSLGQG